MRELKKMYLPSDMPVVDNISFLSSNSVVKISCKKENKYIMMHIGKAHINSNKM
jgi:hypothetical protein